MHRLSRFACMQSMHGNESVDGHVARELMSMISIYGLFLRLVFRRSYVLWIAIFGKLVKDGSEKAIIYWGEGFKYCFQLTVVLCNFILFHKYYLYVSS